jgi:hypothetical protein
MAIESKISNSYLVEILAGGHTSANTYNIALFNSTASVTRGVTYFTAIAGVANGELPTANGYTLSGTALTGFAVTLSVSKSVLDFADVAWPAASFAARGCVIYNTSSASKAMVASFDFGSTITGGGGTFTVVFPTPDSSTGLIRLDNSAA